MQEKAPEVHRSGAANTNTNRTCRLGSRVMGSPSRGGFESAPEHRHRGRGKAEQGPVRQRQAENQAPSFSQKPVAMNSAGACSPSHSTHCSINPARPPHRKRSPAAASEASSGRPRHRFPWPRSAGQSAEQVPENSRSRASRAQRGSERQHREHHEEQALEDAQMTGIQREPVGHDKARRNRDGATAGRQAPKQARGRACHFDALQAGRAENVIS